MGNYEQLKQSVSDVIKTNGNQEIAGSILQNVLLTIISTVGANATFVGIATPTTNPGTPDGPVFYLASEGGTYTNFNGVILNNEVAILSNENGSWVKTDSGIATSTKVTELENKSLYYSVNNREFYKENAVITDNRNRTTDYFFSSNLNIKGSIIGVRVVESCEMKIVTVADLDNASDNTLSEHKYILESGINIFESPIILEDNQYLAFSGVVRLIRDYDSNLYKVSDGSKDTGYAICVSVIISEIDNRLPKLESEVSELDGKSDNLYNNVFYKDSIDKNLNLEVLKFNTHTRGIFYSGIHTDKCGGVFFKAKKGTVEFYKVKVDILGGDGTYELLKSIKNSDKEEGTVKSIILECTFEENEYLGISGDIYFGVAEGYTMYQIGSSPTVGYALAYIPFMNVNLIHKELYTSVPIDENLNISKLSNNTDTSDIFYSGIYCEKCISVSYKAKEGVTRFYKVIADTLGGEATFTLLAEFTNDTREDGFLKTVNLSVSFGENEYLGISGSIYYGAAKGYTMYVIGKNKTDNFALAYMPIKEVSIISELQKELATNIFEVGADRKYKTINDAVNDAVNFGTKENPAVIMIYPGVYNEYCNINGKKYLSIIGVDKKRCIWRYDDANYIHAPLRIAGNCYVKNITFITTAKDYISDIDHTKGFDAWKRDNLAGHYPPGYPTWLGKLGSYAVHCDDEHNDDGELVVSTFEDCVMYSETMPAFGAGLWPSYKIELIRCDLIGKYDKEFYDHVNLEGSLYVHGLQAGQISGVYKEHLYMKDCTVTTNYKRAATFQKVASQTEDLDYLFYYNIFDSEEASGTDLITFDGVNINPKSYGNNTTLLNGLLNS